MRGWAVWGSATLVLAASACGAAGVSTSTSPAASATSSPSASSPPSTAGSTKPSTTASDGWGEQIAVECKKILDEFAAVPRDRSPAFLDKRAEMAEKLVTLVQSSTPPAAMQGRVAGFVEAMSAQARYDHDMANALRTGATPGSMPPSGTVPTLGLKCGDAPL